MQTAQNTLEGKSSFSLVALLVSAAVAALTLSVPVALFGGFNLEPVVNDRNMFLALGLGISFWIAFAAPEDPLLVMGWAMVSSAMITGALWAAGSPRFADLVSVHTGLGTLLLMFLFFVAVLFLPCALYGCRTTPQ